MTRIRIVGLCVVLACAFGAISATTAQAGEYGVCVKTEKVEKKYTGKYEDKNCTKTEAEGEGKYEWEPYPAESPVNTKTNWSYTGTSKSIIIESFAADFSCTSSTEVGETTGVKKGRITITLNGCISRLTKESCNNTATVGQIVTRELETTLIDHGEKGEGGNEPPEGKAWTEITAVGGKGIQAEFECFDGEPFWLEGSIAGVTTENVNTMSTKVKTTFNIEGGEQDLLASFDNPFNPEVETGPWLENYTEEEKGAKIEIKA